MAFDYTKDGVRIISDGKFLVATLANGDVIPMQTGLKLNNDLDTPGYIGLEVTLKTAIPIDDFEIIKKHIKE